MPSDPESTVDELLAMTADELFRQLLSDSLPSAGMVDESDEERSEKGRRLFERHRTALAKIICPHSEKLEAKLREDRTQLVIAVGDLVAASTIGLPPFLIGALIAKIGVATLCLKPDEDNLDFVREILLLENDRFFSDNGDLFQGELTASQEAYLEVPNPLTGDCFTIAEVLKMQHLPSELKRHALESCARDHEILGLLENTELATSESLALEVKTYVLPDGRACIIFSYNFFQFLHNLCSLLVLSYGVEEDEYAIKNEADLGAAASSLSTFQLSALLKHRLIAGYRGREFQHSPSVRLLGKPRALAGLMLTALEMFVFGHEIGHLLKRHVDAYRTLEAREIESGGLRFKELSRRFRKTSEFDADWLGFQFAARFLDHAMPDGPRSQSNDIVLEVVWHLFAFLTQAGDSGSERYPMPVDRAHVLFLTVWGNQAKIPQFNNRARQIRALYTSGIGLYEERIEPK